MTFNQITTIGWMKMLVFLIAGFLHTFGLVLLGRVKPSQYFNSIQRFYLINLSICELFISVENSVLEFILRVTSSDGQTPDILNRLMDIGSFTWFIGLMILMTTDRFFTVLYPLRYPVYWTDHKAKIAVGCLLLCSTTFALIYAFLPFDKKTLSLYRAYYWMIFLILFLVVVLGTYSYIIKRISTLSRMDAIPSSSNNNNNNNNARAHSRFKRSLIVPSLIIGTFILLWAVPFVISFIGIYIKVNISAGVWQFAIIIFGLGFVSDALTYIFLQPGVRRMLKKMLGIKKATVGIEETTHTTV